MDLKYDMKFEEMKKYIPFLESMIKKLESSSSSSVNPRQAQLDKIRSLRDLLLDKKKRMKMENLLKCEQVLVNLHAKVEQRDTLPGIEPASEAMKPNAKSDLNLARSKLKTVANKSDDPDTLPEIARPSETEVVCVPGSKEPALFQRRPNISSLSPTKPSSSDKSPQKSTSKRNYTRVLLSPDRSTRDWSASDGTTSDQLFSRRSPPRQSRRHSPSYHKRERKKSSKQESHSRKPKDLNITLKVPEDRLNSLNTKDILSRIINCSDGDVDITTLRELRTQILGELKQTGANEDISDLILKSYKSKKRANKKDDVEEGELSDSESEAIESIYGNLVLVDKDKRKDTSSNRKKLDQDQAPRKIQICLVVNSDKEEDSSAKSNKKINEKQKICDINDFEMFDDGIESNSSQPASSIKDKEVVNTSTSSLKTNNLTSPLKANHNKSQEIITIEDFDAETNEHVTKKRSCGIIDMNDFDLQSDCNNSKSQQVDSTLKADPIPFKANFYKPLVDPAEATNIRKNEKSLEESVNMDTPVNNSADKQGIHEGNKSNESKIEKESLLQKPEAGNDKNLSNEALKIIDSIKNTSTTENLIAEPQKSSPDTKTTDKDPEIPLLNEPTVQPVTKDVVSEIDILQALKNEILSETISIPCAEVATPALHQPKITKVSNAQELPKKRISIENYKQKSAKPSKTALFVNDPSIALSKEESRKQSLKLTEKEVERFNLISKIALNDSSDDDDHYETIKSPDVMDLAPKSPDVDITNDANVSPPVIIPVDPVKMSTVSSKADVDMRKIPIMSPPFGPTSNIEPMKNYNPEPRNTLKTDPKWPPLPVDPRVRRDKEGLLPTPLMGFSNSTPTRTPLMTPSRTPTRVPNIPSNSRSFEMTPSRQFEMDEGVRKHVYAPMFPTQDNTGERTPVWEPPEPSPVHKPIWEAPGQVPVPDRDQASVRKWDDRDPRSSYAHRDDGPRSRYGDSKHENSQNRNDRYHSREDYSRQDCPRTPSYYGRSECPATPTPSFGRGDAPATPSHCFGRSEGSMTPSHPFGRSEAPLTPSHPFGRSEPPLTPSHPFGRSEAPSTPSHPFGRSEAPMTPNHPFGRSDYSYNNQSYGKPQDPRLNRSYDNDSNSRSDRGSHNDRYKQYMRNDPRSNREQNERRNDKKPYTPDQSYNREQMPRRETSVGPLSKDHERDPFYTRDRNQVPDNSRSYTEVGSRRTAQREESIGRSMPDQRSRASSVGRTFGKPLNNKLSVESHAGRAFTIDTSVNRTFQKLIDSHRSNESSSFDIRRQRASSVGRSITRESSVGRSLPYSSPHNTEYSSRNKFTRAQSVGRDLSRAQSVGRSLGRSEKSFKDIKAEFESYRRTESRFKSENTIPSRTNENIRSRDPRRRDSYDKQQDKTHYNKTNAKEINVPVKKINYRDPRQRKEQQRLQDRFNDRSNRNRSDSRDRHSYGISSDIVTKNPVINSVKNYKIPKIKRPPEEKPAVEIAPVKVEAKKISSKPIEKDAKPKSVSVSKKVEEVTKSEKKTKADKMIKKEVRDDQAKTNVEKTTVEKTEKRVTRQSGRKNEISQSLSESDDDKKVVKTRKFKKVIYNSDSDDNSDSKKVTTKTESPKKLTVVKTKNESTHPDKNKETEETNLIEQKTLEDKKDKELEENQETLDSSFGLDDIDLFSDNIITDPVLDNINALIADLDNDLDAPKGDSACNDLFNEISIENMLEKITSSPAKPNPCEVSQNPVSTSKPTVKKDLFDSLKESDSSSLTEIDKPITATENNAEIREYNITSDKIKDQKSETKETPKTSLEVGSVVLIEKKPDLAESKEPQFEIISRTDNTNDPEDVVSTSVNEDETPNKDISVDSGNLNGRSTPDSTNDAEVVTKNSSAIEKKPDSTVEKQCEMNSDISSTHDTVDKVAKETRDVNEPATKIESIGSLLSMLQDKSKLKELLNMLGGQSSENEKIKKKLEKLSEIVSDDEDSNDVKAAAETEKNKSLSEDKVEIEVQKNDKEEVIADERHLTNVEDRNEHKVESITDNNKKNQFADSGDGESEKVENKETDSINTNKLAVKELDQPKESKDVRDEASSKSDNDDDRQQSSSMKKMPCKISKLFKTRRMKRGKGKKANEAKRVTRSEATVLQIKPGPSKKPSRELKQLQESIKEMFMSDDILNASGIRMCRLAKMVDDKRSSQKDDVSSIDVSEPVVVLEKVKHVAENEEKNIEKPLRKKPGPKPKVKPDLISPNEKKVIEEEKPLVKYKPGPKSKTRITQEDKDPYDFETDSLNDSKASDKFLDNSSESDDESLASSKSYGSSELLVELKKKPKRKRKGGWKTGVIKPKHKKRKIEMKRAETPPTEPAPETERKISIPDHNCFTDKIYCFSKNVSEYSCRLCESTHSGADIVFHYKKRHPHSEIPLSRMSPETAKEAIEQCEEINFQAISKIPTDKYTCRFCYKEFAKKKASLEAFFWHVVSMHTGEYKQLCSECINVTRCPFNLDIPPPPKDIKGQLIGYICGKCNFTQISLENLKTHVIVRHNDEQTEVYTINFAVMTKKTINSLAKRCSVENQTRVTRSSRSTQSLTEPSDDRSDITESEPEMARVQKKSDAPVVESPNFSFKSKINFETDDNISDISNIATIEDTSVKVERDDEEDNQQDTHFDEPLNDDDASSADDEDMQAETSDKAQAVSDDIMDYPHFKIRYTDTGNKEYVCCINGIDNHYKTGLLISMKKHVQLKHSEKWDGYCFVCKVIVTPQGQHKFSDCLLHFLDKHIDDFPVFEEEAEPVKPVDSPEPPARSSTPKTYINVRPLSDLLVKPFEAPVEKPTEGPVETPVETPEELPVIENVMSLLPSTVEPPRPSPTYPVTRKEDEPPKEYKYEEAQAEVMSKKHRVVLDAMMAPEKLVQVFKCAGQFCSFTTHSAEAALLHASTHQRVGGTNALSCSYCDFDSSGNAIDLVSHVFKNHGVCQFVCGLCFYRAAASQLVSSHIARVHKVPAGQGAVLKANNAPPIRDATMGHLTREAAVPLYICKQSDHEGACSFRTVTHTKFWEHLTQRHAEATGFICYICARISDNATSLVLHLKTHGLKLYHCTCCVFGADTEPELLAHASAKHPAQPPLAYIRTICGISGNGSFKMLPLVELKKAVLPSEEVAVDKNKENPEQEAKRSIELEKLIGLVNQLDEPAASPAPAVSPAPSPAASPDDSARVMEVPHRLSPEVDDAIPNPAESPALAPMATLIPVPPLIPIAAKSPVVPITPPPAADRDLSQQLTPILKEEPKDTTPEKVSSDDVICLDSDDEDSKQGIISLSDDETPNTTLPGASPELKQILTGKKISNLTVFKCENCTTICSTIPGFKKHLHCCYAKGAQLKCAHCGQPRETVDAMLTHYTESHGSPARYSCGLCQLLETTLASIKKHVKQAHNVTKLVVTSSSDKFGEIQYVVGGRAGPAKAGRPSRRKPSASAAAKRCYGPADIDKLPINPIMDEPVHCDICEFHTKVRLNMVRHLQQHAELQPVAQTAPVNPVPHLETNEKHFDKMVNLASSSAAARAPDKPSREPAMLLAPEEAASYPKFVHERQRFTCGALGCAYISLDEGMLRRHWETLHPGAADYHCVHCPPHQHLDRSKPLTATRILGHLKMHDTCLYACSLCPYYHYKLQVLEKHVADSHRSGRVVVVREEAAPAPAAGAAPTMDLKPWQCGLCKFKSMLRPEVAEHCSKFHQSKMQYKCAYCPFRTSMPENVTKHQAASHPNREQEIFYFYYREGSIPDAADGTPHWQKQRQKAGLDPNQEVKAEVADTTIQTTGTILPQIRPQVNVNLNLVKQEVDQDSNEVIETVEGLCKKFGEFCEPNGLNYKCSLCKVVVEDSKVAMQCHLFEELKYRKWGCRLCSYKAFHQTGLKEHMWTEHRQNQAPIELSVDVNVESWVSKLLDYQEDLIKKNREKLAQQKIQVERAQAPAASRTVEVSNSSASKLTIEELEKAFGPLGASSNMMFVCPKCKLKAKDEVTMQDHLESELTRIRWCCSNCSNNFTTYHEAQFHCKSMHAGQAARPVEAPRDPVVRAAWVAAVLSIQRLAITVSAAAPTQASNLQPDSESNDSEENSLLVIRYEENVPTPEEETLRRKRAASAAPDSDDENLVIDETHKRGNQTDCPHCTFTTKYKQMMNAHILRHYNLKPFTCPYCEFNGNKPTVLQHIASQHNDKRAFANRTKKPLGPPTILDLTKPQKKVMVPVRKVGEDAVCLTCEKVFSDSEAKAHVHDKDVPKFGKKGEVVVKCCECLLLFPDVVSMQQHNTDLHPSTQINYAYYKLLHDTRALALCCHCNQRFSHLIDLKSHHNAVHSSLKLSYKTIPYVPCAKTGIPGFGTTYNIKRKAEDKSTSSPKRVAKKSTTKLPCTQSVAKKSTTKLPFYVDSDSESEEEEYSYYGTKPSSWEEFANVTTLMPFCNTMVPFSLKKLSEIIKIDPKVVVKDLKK